ncbi:hypothetical protein [Vibrio vulnificus]|uniref:hypothetical protein n=1 Tax=Vibrio vulnificus TaxID=672 RepID=UPI003241DB0F
MGKFIPSVAETWFGEEKRVPGQITSKSGHRCLAKFFWVSLVVPVFELSASRVQWFTAVDFGLSKQFGGIAVFSILRPVCQRQWFFSVGAQNEAP